MAQNFVTSIHMCLHNHLQEWQWYEVVCLQLVEHPTAPPIMSPTRLVTQMPSEPLEEDASRITVTWSNGNNLTITKRNTVINSCLLTVMLECEIKRVNLESVNLTRPKVRDGLCLVKWLWNILQSWVSFYVGTIKYQSILLCFCKLQKFSDMVYGRFPVLLVSPNTPPPLPHVYSPYSPGHFPVGRSWLASSPHPHWGDDSFSSSGSRTCDFCITR